MTHERCACPRNRSRSNDTHEHLGISFVGPVRRDIRRFGAGRESGFFHPRARAGQMPLAVLPWIAYLALPISVSPMLILLPSAVSLGFAASKSTCIYHDCLLRRLTRAGNDSSDVPTARRRYKYAKSRALRHLNAHRVDLIRSNVARKVSGKPLLLRNI